MNYLEDNGQLKTYTGSKITPNELEKNKENSLFLRHKMPKILTKKKGKMKENQEKGSHAFLYVVHNFYAFQLFLLTKSSHQVWQFND